MEVYEETADIDKQAFVREEVNIKKEVQRDTVDATEQVRREELDVDVDNESIIDRDRVNRDRINRNR
jgi:stress response protein YsnF